MAQITERGGVEVCEGMAAGGEEEEEEEGKAQLRISQQDATGRAVFPLRFAQPGSLWNRTSH